MARTDWWTDRGRQAADILVMFGITGDLARVMTFRSLYRLEARELTVDCGGWHGPWIES